MIRLCVSVRDSASGVFGQPFFVAARGQAIRAFSDEVNRKAQDNDLNKHPEDFELFVVGEWDDNSGRFGSLGEPESLIRGKDCINTEQ